MTLAIVVPTIRPDQYTRFVRAWSSTVEDHGARVVTVWDGDTPTCEGLTAADILGDDADLIYHRSDVCRNLGFAFVARYLPDVDVILTLDDDVAPHGETIADHLRALSRRAPISWMSSSPSAYLRGFPYGVRDEAPVMVSHGIWYGNADWDARTQLENGNAPLSDFYRGPVPKGALMPVCSMNLAFRREALSYVYQAPMGPRASLDGQVWDRFGDIWGGISLKRALDARGWAMVTGEAACWHTRASDVQVNLKKEATGLEWNELYWQTEPHHPYFTVYAEHRARWERWVRRYE